MPTRLTRYVLGEILTIFLVSLVVLTTLVLVIAVGRELVRQGLGVAAIARLMPFAFTISLKHTIPATVLFAVCCVYGRMSADGEVATVKASGISPWRLLQPALVLGLLLSPLSVWLTDLAVSWGRPGIERVVLSSIEDISYRVLRAQYSYTSEHGFSIHVRDVIGDRLIRPTVTVNRPGSSDVFKLTAQEGKLAYDADTQKLMLTLVDSHLERGDQLDGAIPGTQQWEIPLSSSAESKDPSRLSPSVLPLRLIRREGMDQDARNHAAIGRLAAHTGFALMTSRADTIAGTEGNAIEQEWFSGRKRFIRLQTEPWRRWAEGFACFFFVVVGAPLAMKAKTSDYWTTFGLCFLPTLLVYYPIFLLGLEQAKDGHLPPYAVWFSNGVLLLIGSVLIAKVRRY